MTRFATILIDPPVPFKAWGKRTATDTRTAASKYPLMTWADLGALGPLIDAVAEPKASISLWICPLLQETMRMAAEWGWEYKTKLFCWVKGDPIKGNFRPGMGYWTMANSEDVFLYTRGRVSRQRKDVRQIVATAGYETETIVAPPGRHSANGTHSAKPEQCQDRIEQLVQGPYLELFARRVRPGWTCLGNEIDGLDIRESLTLLAAGDPIPALCRGLQTVSML